jgi:polyferredoxin
MTWTLRIRLTYQTFFLALFVWLFARLFAGDERGFPYSLFHHADPLSAAVLPLAAGTLPPFLWWGIGLILLTLVFGRVFCGWICPLGTLQQFSSWLLTSRTKRESLKANRWRPWFVTKSYVLVALLVGAVFGSLQTGLLDPLSLLARGLASGLWPLLPGGRAVPGGWLAAALLITIVVASRFLPRLFCRALCPLGAFLGFFARFALFRIARHGIGCTDCTHCTFACQGADEPLKHHRVGECHVCLNCLPKCPEGALSFDLLPSLPPAPARPDLSRRALFGTALGAAVVGPLLRASGGGRDAARAGMIRPPGSLGERDFLSRCVKCSFCQQTCPTGAIQSAIGEAGVEGFWTPIVVPRRGGCEFACTRCGEACPTGAIQPLLAPRKTGYDGKPPVRIGTAFIDRGRCLPWAMQTPCIVCEEVCPTDPKAIWFDEVEEPLRGSTGAGGAVGSVRLKRPRIEPGRCVGCGICENKCPVGEEAAVRVTSVGETRDPLNRMLLAS